MQAAPHTDPKWLTIARAELGVREVPGSGDAPRVLEYLAATRLPPSMMEDQTPWCSCFVCWVMERAGIPSTRSAAARSWLRWGVALPGPELGAVVVLTRPAGGPGSGHVGLWLGPSARGPRILGGNQGNAVSVQVYPASRVLGYRWPTGVELPRA